MEQDASLRRAAPAEGTGLLKATKSVRLMRSDQAVLRNTSYLRDSGDDAELLQV